MMRQPARRAISISTKPCQDLRIRLSQALVPRALKLALPVSGAYLVVVLGLLAEFLIVGNVLGGPGIAAIGLAGTLALLLVLSCHALELGTQALVARRYGEGAFKAAGLYLDNAIFLAVVIGVPVTVGLYFLGPEIFSAAEDRQIRVLAFEYFRWRLPSLPMIVVVLVLIGFFNAIGRPQIPMAVYAVILSLNALLCFLLVGGRGGLPEMGLRGAGLAHTLSTGVGLVIFLTVLTRQYYRREFRVLRFARHFSFGVQRQVLRLSGPIFVQQFLGNFGMFLFVLINAAVPDGGISLSASTIARQIGYLAYLPSIGFGIAAATLVGQFLGARQPHRAAMGALTCWMIGASLMAAAGVLFIIFRHQLVGLFLRFSGTEGTEAGAADPTAVAELAALLLIVVGIYQVLESVSTIIGKALQGAGETVFVMTAAVSTQWLIFLPVAWVLALPMGLGAYGAIWAFAVQLAVLALILMTKFRAPGWKRRVI